MKKLLTLTVITSSLVLGACTTSKDRTLPTPDKNMRQVYEQHMGGMGEGKVKDTRMVLRRPLLENDVDLATYSRTESNHLTSQFTFLPNPVLVMYVAPHLATSTEIPVPGYVTQFRMYEKDHYALPSEMVNYGRYPDLPLQELPITHVK